MKFVDEQCFVCFGEGEIAGETCPLCLGDGYILVGAWSREMFM